VTAPDPVLAYKRGAKRMSDRIRVLERENAGLWEAFRAKTRQETTVGNGPVVPSERHDGDLVVALSRAQLWMLRLASNGPDLTVNAHRKAAHEAAEFADDPTLEEAADVLICLAGAALAHDWSIEDIARAVQAKTSINARRHWEQQGDGTWQHSP
jgi:predicted house-cleaning noncanonical NTP pyrophosphatase (MazG superfamily)